MNFFSLHRLFEAIRSSFWFTPLTMATGALVLAILFRWIDDVVPASSLGLLKEVGRLGTDGARVLLSTLAGSMITVAGVIFSITIVALNMTSAQFGPGLLQKFMKSGETQSAMGTFIASFIFSLMTLLQIPDDAVGDTMPIASISAAVTLGILSFFVMIYFIHHTAQLLQVTRIVDSVAEEAIASFDRLFDDTDTDDAAESNLTPPQGPSDDESTVVLSRLEGYIQTVDFDALLASAAQHDVVMRFDKRIGQYLIRGQEIARMVGDENAVNAASETLWTAIQVGPDRTVSQDPEFAVEQLAEVAVRSLSPGINDPYTAIICIDQIGRVIGNLGRKREPDYVLCDQNGRARLYLADRCFSSIIGSAFDTVRQNANGQPAVQFRLIEVLRKLAGISGTDDYVDALSEQLEMMREAFVADLRLDGDRRKLEDRYQLAVRALAASRSNA